jgi:hypothetical protein
VLLTELNLANNDLSGVFPILESFPLLTVLNLSSNANLTGVLSLPANLTGVLSLPDKILASAVMSGSKEKLPLAMIIGVSVAIILLVAISALLTYKCYLQPILAARRRRARHDESSEFGSAVNTKNPGSSIGLTRLSPSMPAIMLKVMGVKDLRITEPLSQGGFGYVYKGVYHGRNVAVKRIIAPRTKRDKLRLAQMFSISTLD